MWKHKLAILAIMILVVSIICYRILYAKPSIVGSSIPDETAASVSETDNSDSASATITITMYALPEEEWS